MKKKMIIRCLIGAPIGLAISTVIAIGISLAIGDGNFYAVVPELTAGCKSEINAVLLQSVCSLLYGAAWAGASAIWEIDNWSILRQTATHLVICSTATFPVAYFMRWMEHNIWGILIYFSCFFAIYFLIWISQYMIIKRHVQQINRKVKSNIDTE